jgi:very-short-patch-repair endonuclease
MFAPPPEQQRAADPAPRGRATVDASGFLVDFEKPQPTPAQRILRESDTRKLERRLWHVIELAGLPLPDELEYRWALPERQFRADGFYRPNLLIEVDGGLWMRGGGGHSHPMHLEAQHERDNLAVLLGYRCLRFTEKMIASGEAVKTLRRALQPSEVTR